MQNQIQNQNQMQNHNTPKSSPSSKAITEKNEFKNSPNVKRNFVGGGWDNTSKYGTFIVLSVKLDKLNELSTDQYGNVKIVVAKRKQNDQRNNMSLMCYASE